MDMMYNLGNPKFKKFEKFIGHAKNNDTQGMINESHRLGIPERRNRWAVEELSKDF